MTNVKAARKALWMSVLALLLCCSMLIGSTFAWFTDSATSSQNKIVAGKLDIELEVETKDGFKNVNELTEDEKLFNVALWEPGVTAVETFRAVNEGDLALKYAMYLSSTNANKVVEADGTVTEYTLADVLKVAVIKGKLDTSKKDAVMAKAEAAGFQKLGTAVEVANGKLLPKGKTDNKGDQQFHADYQTLNVVVYWEPTGNDNLYNLNNGKKASSGEALTIDFGVTLSATQVPYEEDSFDMFYDDGIALSGAAAVMDAVNMGIKDSNAALAEATTDENGNQLVWFDDALFEETGELNGEEVTVQAITLHFEDGAVDYINETYNAVKDLIGNAVDAQAGNIYSVELVGAQVRVLNGNPFNDGGSWIEADLKTVAAGAGGLQKALEMVASEGVGLDVIITDMAGNAQVYRMYFDLAWID